MNRASHRWVSGGLVLVLAWACGGEGDDTTSTCTRGRERCACHDDESCDGTLRCLSKVCVASNAPRGSGGAADAGSAGDGGEGDAGGVDAGGATGATSAGGNRASGGSQSAGGNAGVGATGGDAGGDSAGASDAGGTTQAGEGGAGGSLAAGGGTPRGGTNANGGSQASGGASPSGGNSPQGGEGGSPGATAFSDDFEDADADGWDAASWMVFLDGDNRVLRQNPEHEGATTPASTGSSTWRDRRMEVSFKFTTAQPVSFAVVGAEFETADDRDQVMVDISGAGTLLHARGGVITSSQFEATIALGTWYRLALEIDGTTLRGYLDGTLVAQLEGVSGVRGGIAVTASQAGDVHYDDVMVTLF